MSRKSGWAAKPEFWPPPPSRLGSQPRLARLARYLLSMHRTHGCYALGGVDTLAGRVLGFTLGMVPIGGLVMERDLGPEIALVISLSISLVALLAVLAWYPS